MNQEIQTALKELQNQLLQLKPAAEHIKQYEEVAQQAMDSFIGIEQLYGSHLDKVKQELTTFLAVLDEVNEKRIGKIQVDYTERLQAIFQKTEEGVKSLGDTKGNLSLFLTELSTANDLHLTKSRENNAQILRGITTETANGVKSLQETKENIVSFLSQLDTSNEQHLNKIRDEHAQILRKISDELNGVLSQFRDNLSKTTALIQASERLVGKIDRIDFPTRLDKLDANISSINLAVQNLQTRIGDSERNLKDRIESLEKELLNQISQIVQQAQIQAKQVNFLKISVFITWGLMILFFALLYFKKA